MQLASFSTRIQIAHALSSRFLELTTQGLSSECTGVNAGLYGHGRELKADLVPTWVNREDRSRAIKVSACSLRDIDLEISSC